MTAREEMTPEQGQGQGWHELATAPAYEGEDITDALEAAGRPRTAREAIQERLALYTMMSRSTDAEVGRAEAQRVIRTCSAYLTGPGPVTVEIRHRPCRKLLGSVHRSHLGPLFVRSMFTTSQNRSAKTGLRSDRTPEIGLVLLNELGQAGADGPAVLTTACPKCRTRVDVPVLALLNKEAESERRRCKVVLTVGEKKP